MTLLLLQKDDKVTYGDIGPEEVVLTYLNCRENKDHDRIAEIELGKNGEFIAKSDPEVYENWEFNVAGPPIKFLDIYNIEVHRTNYNLNLTDDICIVRVDYTLSSRRGISNDTARFWVGRNTEYERYGIAFDDYFAAETSALAQFERDGLLQQEGRDIRITPAGRALVRNICMAFDRYLNETSGQRFSRLI